MWELVKAGGWLMLPLYCVRYLCLAISVERAIRLKRVWYCPTPSDGPAQNADQAMQKLQQSSALKNSTLGRVFTAGLKRVTSLSNMLVPRWK